MSDIKTSSLQEIRNKCGKMDVDKLRKILAEGIKIIRENLLWAACSLAELELRGEGVEGERWLFAMLRRIASGEMLVDVVVRFGGSSRVMSYVASLPPKEQEQMLKKKDKEVKEIVTAKLEEKKDKDKVGEDVESVVKKCQELIKKCTDPDKAAKILTRRMLHYLEKSLGAVA